MLFHYFKIAFRDFRKHKIQTGICIVGISIGLVCFTFCAYYAQLFTGIDAHYPDVDRMFSIVDRKTGELIESGDIGRQLQQQYPEIIATAACSFSGSVSTTVSRKDGKDYFFDLACLEIDCAWLDFFSIRPVEGFVDDRPGTVILTRQAAQKLFSGESAVGKQIGGNRTYWVKDRRSMRPVLYTVCAVIPDIPRKSIFNLYSESVSLDGLLVNSEPEVSSEESLGETKDYITAIKLAPTVSPEAINRKLERFRLAGTDENLYPEGVSLISFGTIFSHDGGAEFTVMLVMVILIGLLVLSVALFNFVSFVLGLFMNRLHECAIRKTLCAGRRDFWLLFFVETAGPVVVAGLLCAVLFVGLYPHFNASVSDIFRIDIQPMIRQLALYIVVGLFLAALLCLIPSGILHRLSIRTAMFGGSGTGRKSRVRMFLLGLQLFVCMLFVSASVMMSRQFRYMEAKTLQSLTPEEKERIIEVSLEHPLLRPHAWQIARTLSDNAHCGDVLPARWSLVSGWSQKYIWDGQSESRWFRETETSVDYPEFMKQPIVEGRIFDPENKAEAVVNEAARHLLDGQALGKSITCVNREQTYTIVGVIGDRPEYKPGDKRVRPAVYLPAELPGVLYVKPKGAPREASDFIMQTVRQYLPDNVDYTLHSLKKGIRMNDAIAETGFRMILIFSVVSLIIGLSGVYSSVSLNTGRRRKEIAIRKINGASMSNIVRMFLRTYIRLLLIVSVPAFAVVYAAVGAWLESYPYRAPMPFWLFFPVFAFPAVILVATILYHLRQTARSNPAEVVKSE